MSELVLAPQDEANLHLDRTLVEENLLPDRARAGDLEAFDAIMLLYEGRLLRFLMGLVGDAEVAADLCQDTFLSAYQALPRVKGELKLSAWLHTIALNHARSHHRRKRHKTFVSIEDHEPASDAPDATEAIAANEVVRRVLSRIPKQYSEALLLQTGSGFSCREIAGVLRCSEGAVKVRLMRARESFRREYGKEMEDHV
ncbi:MAG: RNA polymerase sigma factor [Chloroflexota bacterium]